MRVAPTRGGLRPARECGPPRPGAVHHSRSGRARRLPRRPPSPAASVARLGAALAAHYGDPAFGEAHTMGDLVWLSLDGLSRRAEPASLRLLSGATAADAARHVA